MNAEGAKKLKRIDRPSEAPAAQLPPAVRLTARVEEWRADRGFGFLRFDEHRIFIHRRDFAMFHRVPVVGDAVEFVLGEDQQGRICARQAELAHDGGRIRAENLVILGLLMVAPITALFRFFGGEYWYATLGVALLPSLLAYLLYADDKGRSRAKAWRVSEKNLHGISMLGGWPGAYLAQRRYRHKTAKLGFQFTFWTTVILHQYVAIDYILDWRLLHALRALLER
jgi:uncharacterized membrane protein YsdA (DUF1294 family)/cold shock CspA family protein